MMPKCRDNHVLELYLERGLGERIIDLQVRLALRSAYVVILATHVPFRIVVADGEVLGRVTRYVRQALRVAVEGCAADRCRSGPDNLREVTPFLEIGHVGIVAQGVDVGVVFHLPVVELG